MTRKPKNDEVLFSTSKTGKQRELDHEGERPVFIFRADATDAELDAICKK